MYFPNIQCSKFYSNPQKIKQFARGLDYSSSLNGNFPGKRTKNLLTIEPDFFRFACNRVLKLFYGPDYSVEYQASSYFQLIDQKDVKDDNRGWIHTDEQSMLTAIIYLSEDGEDFGTSLYIPKVEGTVNNKTNEEKKLYYKNQSNKIKYNQAVEDRYKEFEKVLSFKSQFNSMIAFDGCNYHSAEFNFLPDQKDRLTQIVFFYKIKADYFPIPALSRSI